MAQSLENGQDLGTSADVDEKDTGSDESLGPRITFYGSEPQLQLTTTQPPPTSEQPDRIYRPNQLCNNTYLETYVLLLSWEDKDPRLPVDREIDRLYDVFERLYHFKVERWKIPSTDSHIRLNEKILELVKLGDDREDYLKVVYYAGHGKLTRNRQSMWTE